MNYRSLALASVILIFGGAHSRADGPPAPAADTPVLTDGVDLDTLMMDANSSEAAVSSRAMKALEAVRTGNPTGKRHLVHNGIGLDVPSWNWDYNRKIGVSGIEVDLSDRDGTLVSVLVDHTPGLSDAVVGNVTSDLSPGANVSKATLATFGPFQGTGTRTVVTVGTPAQSRSECVLFYPKNLPGGCYLFTLYSGAPAPSGREAEIAGIVASAHSK
jgi:hypothetical protein